MKGLADRVEGRIMDRGQVRLAPEQGAERIECQRRVVARAEEPAIDVALNPSSGRLERRRSRQRREADGECARLTSTI
jgi:hypothetical protein